VPLTAIVFRKAAIFGDAGDGKLNPQENLFWNSRPGVWYENKTDRKTISDFYYLVVLPYNKIHLLDVESYATKGSQRELRLEEQSKITIDVASTSYAIEWRGATITADGSTSCPVDPNRIAFYSRTGGLLTYPIPTHWKTAEITARSLAVDDRQPFPVQVVAGKLSVDAPSRVPIMVYAAADAIHSSVSI
jgi:hypothetical protein